MRLHRRVRLFLFLVSAFAPAAFATISGNTAWDVRTTGSNVNGGGFDSTLSGAGTDFSQQNAAQIAYTDMLLGTGGTSYTSVANPAVANIVANVVQVISGAGCTPGFYQVTAVSTGVATLDRSAGTAASVCTANLGGSLATPAQAVAEAGNSTVSASGLQTINIKTGTYTQTGSTLIGNTFGVQVIGYGTTHRDGGTSPNLTTSTNNVTIFDFNNGSAVNWLFSNVTLSSTAATPGFGLGALGANITGLYVFQCKFSGFAIGVYGNDDSNTFIFSNVVIASSEFSANKQAVVISGTLSLFQNYIHGQTGTAVTNLSAAPSGGGGSQLVAITIVGNVFSGNNVAIGVSAGSWSYWISGNTIYNSTGDGISFSSLQTPVRGLVLQNNIIYGNGGFGIDIAGPQGPAVINRNNAYGANTSGARNNLTAGSGDVSLTASPFVSAGTGNFALNSTAGGGAAARAAGFPGTFGAGTISTGFVDIGPLQSQAATGGGQKAFPIVQ